MGVECLGGLKSEKQLRKMLQASFYHWNMTRSLHDALSFLLLLPLPDKSLFSFFFCCSFVKSSLTLCNPMNCSMIGFPVFQITKYWGSFTGKLCGLFRALRGLDQKCFLSCQESHALTSLCGLTNLSAYVFLLNCKSLQGKAGLCPYWDFSYKDF